MKVHFLNTVWSDCIVLEHNGKYAFIDSASGFYYPMIQEYIKKNDIKEIEFIFLTHFHSDHYTNIGKLVTDYKVKKVYFRDYSGHNHVGGDGKVCDEDYNANELKKQSDIIDAVNKYSELIHINDDLEYVMFEGIKLEVYGQHDYVTEIYNDPTSEFYHVNKFGENYMSVSLYFEYNGHNVYLGGDVTNVPCFHPGLDHKNTQIINEIFEKHNIKRIKIYKTPHHGGSGANNQETFDKVKPYYGIMTNTDKWLDEYKTADKMLIANPKCKPLKTDHYQYVFDLEGKKIKLNKIKCESLFITLNKN